MIERLSPVGAATESYLLEAIFRGTWGERLRPYLSDDDYDELARVCDPRTPGIRVAAPRFSFSANLYAGDGEVYLVNRRLVIGSAQELLRISTVSIG